MLNTLRICTPSTCCPQDLLWVIRLGVFAAVLWSPEDERQDASLRETNSIFVWDLMTESGESESSTPRPSSQKKKKKKRLRVWFLGNKPNSPACSLCCRAVNYNPNQSQEQCVTFREYAQYVREYMRKPKCVFIVQRVC